MDGALALVQTAMPLLALRLGATSMLLGTIGWVAQAIRLPVCLTAGHLSEKVGRTRIIVPAACVFVIGCILFGHARSNLQVIVLYAMVMTAIGWFYPPLQALIGDVSERGQLTKNLGAFNIGWCVGGAVMGVAARWMVGAGLPVAFYAAAAAGVAALSLVLLWRRGTRGPVAHKPEEADQPAAPDDDGTLLLIARMGHFTGFFGYATIRILFPKLARSGLHWSETTIATAVAMVLVGQAAGILAANVSPWWRGKLWPQMMAQAVMLASGVVIALSASPIILGAAFLAVGGSLAIAYTAALYHGLSSRKDRGRNTGIHEALVAAGGISGCLIGGLVAQRISLTAPYHLLAGLAGSCLVVSAVLWRRRPVQTRRG
jgi:MFS family permease